MANVPGVGYTSENSEDVDVGDDVSSRCSAIVGGYEPSSPTVSSGPAAAPGPDDDAVESSQRADAEEDDLCVCPSCGSFFDPSTRCPRITE